MNDEHEIIIKVREFILEKTFSDGVEFNNDTMIFKDGILDSMGLVTLISFLEEQFNIQTEDIDLVEENFESLNAIADFIERKK